MEFLKTDTLLYFANPNDETGLYTKQYEEWAPIIHWANNNYELHLKACENLVENPQIPDDSWNIVKRWLLSNNFAALTAIQVILLIKKKYFYSLI